MRWRTARKIFEPVKDGFERDEQREDIGIDLCVHRWDDTCGYISGFQWGTMTMKNRWKGIGMVALATAGVTIVCHAQDAPAAHAKQIVPTSLVVSGYDGQVPVIQRNGHAYVEVEGLARITESSVSFHGSRIVLILPQTVPPNAAPPSPTTPQAPTQEEKGYSREFLRAAVEEMSVIREWRSAIENAIRTNNPVEQSWVSNYRTIADTRMEMASASATTDADRQALALLQNAKSMIQQLGDRFLSMRSNLSYVSPDSLDNDPLDKKILACAQGVAGQAIPGGQFQDVGACH
jgi:hypothetical protein